MRNTSLERGDFPNCTFLIAPAKILGARGASHHPAFIVLSTQWMKEMRTWGRSSLRKHLIVLSFGVNQVHCFGLKPRVRGKYLMCIVSAKTTQLRERLKCRQGDTS